MSSKKRTRFFVSIIIFLCLLIALLLQLFVFNHKKGDAIEIFNNVDYNTIDSIEYIMPLTNNTRIIIFKDSGNTWKIQRNDTIFTADSALILNNLWETTKVRPDRVVSTTKDKLEENWFTDDKEIKVKYFSKHKEVCNFEIGFNEYIYSASGPSGQQQFDRVNTFVKISNSMYVYSIKGYLRTFFNTDISLVRKKTAFVLNKDDITAIKGDFVGTADDYELIKNNYGVWYYNNTPVTDNQMPELDNFLQRISVYTGFTFYYKDYSKDNEEVVTIESKNREPMVLKFFEIPTDVADRRDYVVESNAYDEGVFYDKNSSQRKKYVFKFNK